MTKFMFFKNSLKPHQIKYFNFLIFKLASVEVSDRFQNQNKLLLFKFF